MSTRARAGTAITIQTETRNQLLAGMPLANPGGGVRITLKNPADVVVLNDVPLSGVAEGIWRTTHQTAPTDPLGAYTAYFTASDAAIVVMTPDMVVFELVAR